MHSALDFRDGGYPQNIGDGSHGTTISFPNPLYTIPPCDIALQKETLIQE